MILPVGGPRIGGSGGAGLASLRRLSAFRGAPQQGPPRPAGSADPPSAINNSQSVIRTPICNPERRRAGMAQRNTYRE
ncbi:hypothetical protein DD683_07660, partial [Bifidobacterium animalis subsp. lactis]